MLIKSIISERQSISYKDDSYAGRYFSRPYDFTTIAETMRLSPYHQKCIHLKVYLSVGLGYEIYVNGEIDFSAKKEFEQLFPDGFTETIQRVAIDFETFGNAYLECVKSRDKFKAGAIYHVPAITMYVAKDGYIQEINNRTIFLEDFRNSQERGVIHIKNYSPDAGYYGVPDWISCFNSILLDIYATEWNYRFFENSCIPSWAIVIKGSQITAEEEDKIREFFQKSYKGVLNAHKVLLMASDNSDISFQKLQDDIKDMGFEKLKEIVRNEIVSAHGVPPRFLGIVSAGSLGGVGEVKWQMKMFKSGILRQRQQLYKTIIDSLLPEGWEIFFNEMDVTELKDDAEFFKNMVEAGIMTPNEARSELGYEVKDELDSIMLAKILGKG